jgi:WD40 repeat protein
VEAVLKTTAIARAKLIVILAGAGLALAGAVLGAKGGRIAPDEKQPPTAQTPVNNAGAAKKEVRVDLYGDRLPPGAVARLGTMRLRHADNIGQVSLSPDGATLATASWDYVSYLWDAATGQKKRRENFGAGRAIAFAADGKSFASGGQNQVVVWDVATDKKKDFRIKADRLVYLAFSPDGKTLACLDEDNAVELLDLGSGKIRHRWEGPRMYVSSSLAFAPDGKVLAIGTTKDSTVRLYDTDSGAELRQLRGKDQELLMGVAFSPDGKTLVSTGGHALYFWDTATGQELRKADPGVYAKAVLYSPGGKALFLGGFDIRLWEPDSAKTLRRFTYDAGGGSVRCVALSGNGKTLAASVDSNNHTVFLWDVATGKRLHDFPGHQGRVSAVAFSPDGKVLATGAGEKNSGPSNTIHLWDPVTGKPLRELGKGLGLVYSVAYAPDGRSLAASNEDGTIRILDPNTGAELRRLAGHQGLVMSIAFSADGKTLASRGYDRTIRIWDVAAGKERKSFPGNGDQHVSIALSADGKIIAEGSNGDCAMRLWDAATGKEVRRLEGFQSGSVSGAFSPDGEFLAVGGEYGGGDELRLVATTTGKLVQSFPGDQQGTRLVVFAPDGKSLAAISGDSIVHVWETVTGKRRGKFLGLGEVFISAAYSPDGKFLAIGSENATAYVFDVRWLGMRGNSRLGPLGQKELESLWADLGDEEAAKAFSAICTMAAAPRESVAFLREHLRPVPLLDAAQRKEVDRWIEELGSGQFAVRQKATRELEKLGERAVPALRAALKMKSPLETRRRVAQLLEAQENWTAERLRTWRALEVLEFSATPDAQAVLTKLAGGADARLTDEAKSSLGRLVKRAEGARVGLSESGRH